MIGDLVHHIVNVHHKHEDAPAITFDTAKLKFYVAYAKILKPKFHFPVFQLLLLFICWNSYMQVQANYIDWSKSCS